MEVKFPRGWFFFFFWHDAKTLFRHVFANIDRKLDAQVKFIMFF